MKRSSKVGLLISVFSMLCAATLGISSSMASQDNEATMKVSHPEYVARMGTSNNVPVDFPTWEEKRRIFETAAQDYECAFSERRLHLLRDFGFRRPKHSGHP